MANADKPQGFKPVRYRDSRPYNGACNIYYLPSSDANRIAIGDLVKVGGTADATGKYPSVTISTAGDYHLGAVVGFVPHPSYEEQTYRTASTERYVLVADDPDLIFEAQEDSAGSSSIAITSAGLNVEVLATASTTTEYSVMEIDTSTVNTTNTLSLRLHRVVDRPDNELGVNAKWLVSINLHANRYTTGA